jgi:hypothetical protein
MLAHYKVRERTRHLVQSPWELMPRHVMSVTTSLTAEVAWNTMCSRFFVRKVPNLRARCVQFNFDYWSQVVRNGGRSGLVGTRLVSIVTCIII